MIHHIMAGGMSCRQVAELSSAFVDGELSGAQWLRYRWHLLMCGPCRAYVDSMGTTVDALRALPGDEGEELRAELMQTFERWKASKSE